MFFVIIIELKVETSKDQTELHVIEECVISQHVRQMYNVTSLFDLVSERQDLPEVCHIVHSILNIYK